MSACYFWNDGEVITVNHSVMQKYAEQKQLTGMYCMDTFDLEDTHCTYGVFIKSSGWVHFPLTTFPKEFRAWLLINL